MQPAWAFLTVSTAKQADTLPDQERWVTEAAAVNGWEISRTFKGVSSGAAGVRRLLAELIGQLERTPKSLRPKRILMIRLDRTGRGLGLDAIAALAEIHKLGVTIHTRQDGDVSLTRVTDAFLPVLRVLTAATENEARRDKALATYAARRAAGKHLGTLAPYGVQIVNGVPNALEPQAAIVRRAFELREQGHGYRTIVRELYGGAPPPKVLRDGTARKMTWNPASVRYMIRCKTYRGIVVDEDQWDRANAVSLRGFKIKEATRYPWPLGGSVQCECGRRLIGNPSKSNWYKTKRPKSKPKVYQYRYYTCISLTAHNGKVVRHKAELLEEQVPRILSRLKATPQSEKQYARAGIKARAEITARIQTCEHDIEQLQRRKEHAWDMAAEGGISNDVLRDRLKTIESQMASAQQTIRRERSKMDTLLAGKHSEERLQDVLGDLVKLWPKAPDNEKKSITKALSHLVGGLYVTTGGALKTFLGPEKDRLQT